jgi:hypothetical protein
MSPLTSLVLVPLEMLFPILPPIISIPIQSVYVAWSGLKAQMRSSDQPLSILILL